MLSWKNVLPAATLVLLLNACGTAPNADVRNTTQTPQVETTTSGSETIAPIAAALPDGAKAGYVKADAADGSSVISCSYSINGKTVEGKTKEDCDRLKKDFEKAAGSIPASVPVPPASTSGSSSDTQVACSFNINGKLYEGKSQAECDKLKKDLGITVNVPTIPVPAPAPTAPAPTAPAPSSGTVTNVACAFNINGKLYEGKSQAECDKLKKDLGFQF